MRDPNLTHAPDGPSPSAAATRPSLVLGSASPRRRDLLTDAGVPFQVIPADIAEVARSGETPEQLVERLACEKAVAVAQRLTDEPGRWVLAADTVVVLDGEPLGKPNDSEHAVELLGRLVGREHRVLTAIALVEAGLSTPRSQVVSSRVRMRPASTDEIRRYVAGGEPLDKAGAYAVQGEGRRFVERIEGSESNVIGLPMDETLALLRSLGLS